MKTKFYFLAALATAMFASCANDEFVGDNSPTTQEQTAGDGSIQFGFDMQNATRANIYGNAAAELLGYNFYVTGTKGTEADNSPSPNVVFNNYLVRYTVNSAGTTETNTANWEYVGIAADANHVKLSPATVTTQTVKYWDYSASQYDFLAFSTGTYKAVNGSSTATGEIGVSAMKYGAGLASDNVAYTFDIPSVDALKNTYITDITEVEAANYGKEVQLQFKNLGSKVRIGLYETVPGYSIQGGSVKFYQEDGTTDFTDTKDVEAALISENESSFASKGTVEVYFHNVGKDNESDNDNYNKASATVTAGDGDTKKTFGNLDSDTYAIAEGSETAGSLYLGRTLPTATFAGDKNAAYYKTVFPVSIGYPLTLRVDYTLISTDGQGEVINVKGAKAVVPSTYTRWLPNYAYTYIFKISDNTNGWTGTGSQNSGLYPITFDAVVAEATDAQSDQTTVTTVATPSITTYQQGHNAKKDGKFDVADEYDNDGGKLYVQVMDNSCQPAKPIGTSPSTMPLLNTSTAESTERSLFFALSDPKATEAKVIDALEKRTTELTNYPVKGRNNLVLTKKTVNNSVTKIVKGVDDNEISVNAGTAAEIDLSGLTAGTYAYVYDYTSGSKNTIKEFQPVTVTPGSSIDGTSKDYYYIQTTDLDGLSVTTVKEPVDHAYIYFSKTKNGSGVITYSYISVSDKKEVPAGVVKVLKTTVLSNSIKGNITSTIATNFYFDTYITNNGSYAVKVIKVVND